VRIGAVVGVALAAVVLLAGCSQGDDLDLPSPSDPFLPTDDEAVRFLAFGDMGTGDAAQASVALGMLQVCRDAGCDFVIGLGDNIYEAGVTSAYDPQFLLKFETPYAGFGIPFYMTLGNHDNWGTGTGHAGGDLEVDYAARTDRDMDLWVMPARWYEHTHGSVRFLALDTNVLFSEGNPQAGVLAEDADGVDQMAWIQERLDDDAWEWTFLHGHHPLFSNGVHGNAEIENPPLQGWLHEAVCGGGVDLLVTGHDHDLQYLPAQEGCGDVEFVISGAAAQVRDISGEANPTLYSCGSTLGFVWMEVKGDVLTTRFHAADATLMAERVLDREDPGRSSFVEHVRPATCTPA
jgi:tartrate-resistant acid phosphatase type 5